MNCNNSQKTAINHFNGPALILAGPGSGKTFTITMRTKHLIDNYHVKPENILVVTFTKAAANEMKERFLRLMDGKKCAVTFGTFHSIFFTIIKYAYNYTVKDVLSEEEKRSIVRKLLELYDAMEDDENELTESVITEISRVKSDGIDIGNYYSKCLGDDTFRKIFSDYERYIRQRNKIDFDDMLVMCYELLSKRKDILSAWQKKFRYILIDEFQDINLIQYRVLRLLASPENNIFAVGDDDQSIYGFRGARPEIMKQFERDYKDMLKVVLDVNYRSKNEIIEASGRLISHNSERFAKAVKGENGNGGIVNIRCYENTAKENEAIIEEIRRYVAMGGDYRDIAIIYRTNMIPRALIEKAMEYNIPFVAKDIIPNIYEHFIFRHIKAYIDIALGSTKRSDYLAIINRPKRYISRDCIDRPEMSIERLRALYDDKRWVLDRLDKLEEDLKFLVDMNPFAAINYIRRSVGYDDYIREYAEYKKINVEELFDIIAQIQEASRDFNDYGEWFAHIEEYTRRIKEENDRNTFRENKDCVTFSTMHSAKGLEYDVVYIIDANEGITPHNKSVLDTDIEEERRMFYVAMTRAKRVLNISSAKERFNKKQEVSRFVREIEDKTDN